MAFNDDLDSWAHYYEPGSVEAIILDYLRKNAVGRKNAKTWPKIARHLEKNKAHCRCQRFQNGLLKDSREDRLFIGSHDCHGFFIIQEPEDAQLMIDFYRKRIEKETERLEHLRSLCEQQWPGWLEEDAHLGLA